MAKNTRGNYQKNKHDRKKAQRGKKKHYLSISDKMPWGKYEGYTIRKVIDGDWDYWNKHKYNLKTDDTVTEYAILKKVGEKSIVSITPSPDFIKKCAPVQEKILNLESKLGYGKLKELTVKKVIDEHYSYWRVAREHLNLGRDVREYDASIRATIKHLSETLKRG